MEESRTVLWIFQTKAFPKMIFSDGYYLATSANGRLFLPEIIPTYFLNKKSFKLLQKLCEIRSPQGIMEDNPHLDG